MKSYFCSNLTRPTLASTLSSPRWCLLHTESLREDMGDGWEFRLSVYVALIWTRFLPTTSQRRDTTILLTFGGGDGPHRAGNDGVLWLRLTSVWATSGASPATYRGNELR
jgi:hypothetical protein